MNDTPWMIRAHEFVNCNCAYGCPCQFNALPTYGHCQAVAAMQIEEGYHGDTRLDGLRFAAVFRWPGAIHEGKGEGLVIIDERATPQQREALLRILSGQDTEPGATVFQVFSTTMETLHEPVFTSIDFHVDVPARRARVSIPGQVEGRGEPIVNQVTGHEHRVRIDLPNGFEYTLAEIGRGWTKATGAIPIELTDSYGQFAAINLCQSGIVR